MAIQLRNPTDPASPADVIGEGSYIYRLAETLGFDG
jgi:hypothetical protein